MKKVLFLFVIVNTINFCYAQSDLNVHQEIIEEMTDEQLKDFFAIHQNLYDLKKSDFDRLSSELKNTTIFENDLKNARVLLEDYIYSISRQEVDKATILKPQVEQIDFEKMDIQLKKWFELIDGASFVFNNLYDYYTKIENLLNENRSLISDYDYRVFTGNIEFKNAPRVFEQYKNAIATKSYEQVEKLIPIIKEINLVPMEQNVLAKIAEMKSYEEETNYLRENLPIQAEKKSLQLSYYKTQLPEPGTFSAINEEFILIQQAIDTVKDLDKADLNKLRGIKSQIDGVNFEFLENSLKEYNKGEKLIALMGMKISKDNSWSNKKQQRYYISVEKDSLAEQLNLEGQLYFSSQKKNSKNDPAPDFTDMSFTDFLINLGKNEGKKFSFIMNKKKNKIIEIIVPEIPSE